MASSFQVVPQTRTARVPRRPQHTFNIECRPWQIVPFFIAPVIPAETMKNLLLQARVVTDPIKSKLTGWWCEFYVWYVKHRDLDEPARSQLVNMMVDPSQSYTGLHGSNAWQFYSAQTAADFVSRCYDRVVDCYFRDANEVTGGPAVPALLGQYKVAQISQQTVLDSALLESAYTGGTADDIVVGVDDTITGSEISQSYILWQQYRSANLTHMTYEEYLSTYGIPLPAGGEGSRRPELVRFTRDWSYPTNTINPVDGAPTSAVSWAIAERADKDRFFREPGWLFGCCCIRPKVYLTNQYSTVSGFMKDALSWLPAVMGDNPEYSVRKFPASFPPFPATTADYRVDLKDLLLYGEQFLNFDPTVSASSRGYMVALPTASIAHKYPTAADADAVFKTPTANFIRVDGIVSLNILGQQIETTPTSAPGGF